MLGRPKTYDVLVIGSGSGATIAESALRQGFDVALVEKGALGGTCANVGCIPTKMLTVCADRVMEIRDAQKLGIAANIDEIDFGAIMRRMRHHRDEVQGQMRHGVTHTEGLAFFATQGRFADERTLQVGNKRIRGKKIFIVAGARPLVPPIEGLDEIDYLDNESALELEELPSSMVIIGGGYIACEFAHFFSAMGTDVTIVQRNQRLVPDEEPEISALLCEKLSERMQVFTGTEAIQARRGESGYVLTGRGRDSGEEREFHAARVMVAAGRRSNGDLLEVHKAGIDTDDRGYIKVNEFFETNVPGIWALGDILGKRMFRHVANRETLYAWHNSLNDHKIAMDYRVTPSAVFTYPQIASVGLREEEAKADREILVGRAQYSDVAKGLALIETDGFAKAIVEAETYKVLGFHIIGPYAPMLIQEVINLMTSDSEIGLNSLGMHIHPAMPEVVVRALNDLHPPD